MHVRLCELMGENTMALTTVFPLGCSQDWNISWSFPSTSALHILQCPPFKNTVDSLLFTLVIDRGLHLLRPAEDVIMGQGLNNSLWELIESCWSQDPTSRPIAALVVSQLGKIRSDQSTQLIRNEVTHPLAHPLANDTKQEKVSCYDFARICSS